MVFTLVLGITGSESVFSVGWKLSPRIRVKGNVWLAKIGNYILDTTIFLMVVSSI
jgi:hypothetical protein